MDFWLRLDKMLDQQAIAIDRPKRSPHPRFPDKQYPLDYGYLEGTAGGDGHGIDVWRGSIAQGGLVGVICTVDTMKNDAELKLLVGCTDEEMQTALNCHNNGDHMSGILIRRDGQVR